MLAGLLSPLHLAVVAGVTAFAITFCATPIIRILAVRRGWSTRSAEDRWGRRVVARFGGIAIFAGYMAAAFLWVPLEPRVVGILIGLALVVVVGIADDMRRMPPYTKLLLQLLVGCAVVGLGVRIHVETWTWESVPLSVLWFVLVMNAFNLLDNMDGLAAGVAAIAAGFCAFHAIVAQQWTLVALAAILGGACVGFLQFNFPPAKIYMGDTGSHFLGLGLATLMPLSSWHYPAPLIGILAVPVLVLAVPIFDTCFVTIQRLLHRQHPFVGGTDHVSHRLAILGLSTRQTVMALYGISISVGLVSVLSASMRPLSALALWCVVVTVLIAFGRYLGRVNVYQLESVATAAGPMPAQPVTRIETLLLHKRRLLEVLIDFIIICGAYLSAHLLRFDGVLSAHIQGLLVRSLPIILVIKIACFLASGLYRREWHRPDLSDVVVVLKAVTFGATLSSIALLYLWRFEGYSRAVLLIDWMICLLAVGGSRMAERLFDEWIGSASAQGTPVLIVGAGQTGERVLRYLKDIRHSGRRVAAFLDDDPRKIGLQIHGVRVVGTRRRLPELLAELEIGEVLIAITDPPAELLRDVQESCRARGVRWNIVAAVMTGSVG